MDPRPAESTAPASDDLPHELRTSAAAIAAAVEALEVAGEAGRPGSRELLLDILELSCERLLDACARARSSDPGSDEPAA